MNTSQTLQQLQSLRLTGMYQHYREILNLPANEHPTGHELLAMLVHAEDQFRVNRKTERYIKLARFRYKAGLATVDLTPDRGIDKSMLYALSDCSFIKNRENILIAGATGCGKSFMATAFGQQACGYGYKVLYVSMPQLADQLLMSLADASRIKLMNKLSKPHLLILDDFGITPMDEKMRISLLQILEDRYDRKSIIITSQLPFNTWYEYIGENTLADAIMDRLTAGAHKFELKGESLRKRTKNNN
jgi:DNA replication protein DnaC